MKVKTVGFYKEMSNGKPTNESIYEYIEKENPDRIDNICQYLESGIEFVVAPGMSEDVINPDKGISGISSIYTDGVWFWPGDLAYYVKNYRLKLPDEFISAMEKNGWKVSASLENLDYNDIEVDGVKLFESD